MTYLTSRLAFLLFLSIYFSLQAQSVIIKNVNILPFTSDTLLHKQSILIQDGTIVQIGKFSTIKKDKNTRIINGKGKYVMPSLTDMHVHLPQEEEVEKSLLSFVAAGVGGIRIMHSETSNDTLQKIIAEEPTLITPIMHYGYLVKDTNTYTPQQADSLMQALKKENIEFVKLYSLSNKETFDHLAEASQKHGMIFCGHYPIYVEEDNYQLIPMDTVLNSHFKSIEHLGGYVYLQDSAQINQALQLTQQNEVYNCPTLDWDIMAANLQYPDRYKNRFTYHFLPKEITQDWEAHYTKTIEENGGAEKVIEGAKEYEPFFQLKLKILKRLYENQCLLLLGGDGGNDFQIDGFNMYEEMIDWYQAGIDNYTILQAATLRPAQFFGQEEFTGTIEVGKDANLILLDKNPLTNIQNISTVEYTIVKGKIYQNSQLIELLKSKTPHYTNEK